ncbi:MAG: TRAP transporter large permease [Methylobacteriaceae bacterium]|jgi:tripartite ATP-independent transporter DctM subunit|nr:TRAP transporter large permease [Methylobacteriaceae bacterium]
MVELAYFFGSLFLFLFLGVPIALVLILCAIVLMLVDAQWSFKFLDFMTIPNAMMDGANNYSLMAIPFFVFAGEIMAAGGLSQRVVAIAQLIMGRIKGGLGYAAILASIIFAGLMGSSVGEAAALGGLLLPMMKQVGYKPGRAGGIIASGAILGPIIPPSTNFIILASAVSGLSVVKLFMIGLVPGIMLGAALMVVWFFIVRVDGYTETIKFTRAETIRILIDSLPAFMMPVLLLGGIRFGVFTPTEGGAFAAVFAILICTLWYRELSFRALLRVSAAAARTTAVVMLIVAGASAVGYYITLAQIPNHVTELFGAFIDSPKILLTIIMLFLLVAGMVMDLTPNVLIFAPVFYPLIVQAGIDPYHFGLIFILNLGIGVITPPVGTVLYVVCGIGNIQFVDLVKKMFPFVIVEVFMMFVLVYFPEVSLVPMRWLMGQG